MKYKIYVALFILTVSLCATLPSHWVQSAAPTRTPTATPIGGGSGQLIAFGARQPSFGNFFLTDLNTNTSKIIAKPVGDVTSRIFAKDRAAGHTGKYTQQSSIGGLSWTVNGSKAVIVITASLKRDGIKVDGSTGVYLLNGKTYTLQQLPITVAEGTSANISPQGDRILLIEKKDDQSQMSIISSAGGSRKILASGDLITAIWNLDGTGILYSYREAGVPHIGYITIKDGKSEVLLTNLPSRPIPASPATPTVDTQGERIGTLRLSPDQTLLLFSDVLNGKTIWYWMRLDEKNPNLIDWLGDTTPGIRLAWLTNNTIVSILPAEKEKRIVIGNLKNIEQTLVDGVNAFTLAASSDGQSIAYDEFEPDGSSIITLFNLENQEHHVLNTDGESVYFPSFQPSGNLSALAYTRTPTLIPTALPGTTTAQH